MLNRGVGVSNTMISTLNYYQYAYTYGALPQHRFIPHHSSSLAITAYSEHDTINYCVLSNSPACSLKHLSISQATRHYGVNIGE